MKLEGVRLTDAEDYVVGLVCAGAAAVAAVMTSRVEAVAFRRGDDRDREAEHAAAELVVRHIADVYTAVYHRRPDEERCRTLYDAFYARMQEAAQKCAW